MWQHVRWQLERVQKHGQIGSGDNGVVLRERTSMGSAHMTGFHSKQVVSTPEVFIFILCLELENRKC